MKKIITTKDIDIFEGVNKEGNQFLEKKDKKYRYKSRFYLNYGLYKRSGVYDNDGFDTGVDPWMSSMPELIDIGVMGSCSHGRSGLCAKAGIECYQNGPGLSTPNMSIENFKRIVDETHGIVFQYALGGRGDVDQHDNFEEMLAYCRENNVVPNFTTSGLGLTEEKVEICKKYCGAVAVSAYSRLDDIVPDIAYRRLDKNEPRKVYKSFDDIPVLFTFNNKNKDCYWDAPNYYINGKMYGWDAPHHIKCGSFEQDYEYFRVYNERNSLPKNNINNYTHDAIDRLLNAGVKTNIHFVLGNNTIDEAIVRLRYNGFPKGINAVIFLLHKPVGLGTDENVLRYDDQRIKEFYSLLDANNYNFQIGIDSCHVPGLINMTQNIDSISYDTCEAGRWSMYITSDMKALPCSFDNQDMNWMYDISNDTIENAWNSKQFENFRNHFRESCKHCKDRLSCLGGCPIKREIVLCNRDEKDLK